MYQSGHISKSDIRLGKV